MMVQFRRLKNKSKHKKMTEIELMNKIKMKRAMIKKTMTSKEMTLTMTTMMKTQMMKKRSHMERKITMVSIMMMRMKATANPTKRARRRPMKMIRAQTKKIRRQRIIAGRMTMISRRTKML